MELTVLERLIMLNLLPKEANFLNLKLMRKLRESLSFSEFELKRLNFTQENDQVKWDVDTDLVKDVIVGETMLNMISEILKKMNDDGKLTNEHFTLYEKFVEKPQSDIAEETPAKIVE